MVAGREVTPEDAKNTARLKAYWMTGEGAAKWIPTETPWTNLYHELMKYMSPALAKQTASRWFIEAFHFAAGSDKNRVLHGKPPRGKRVGPG